MEKPGTTLPEDRAITGEELYAPSGSGRCELIEGRIVGMTPTGDEDGGCEASFGYELTTFVGSRGLGKVSVGDDLPGDDVLPGFSVPPARLFEG